MLTFYEFIQSRNKPLPDPLTMLKRAGIDLGGPHEVEVMRAVKREKKAAERGPGGVEWWRVRGAERLTRPR